jgi:hypothetical protein
MGAEWAHRSRRTGLGAVSSDLVPLVRATAGAYTRVVELHIAGGADAPLKATAGEPCADCIDHVLCDQVR